MAVIILWRTTLVLGKVSVNNNNNNSGAGELTDNVLIEEGLE